MIPADMGERVKEWDEAETEKQREEFMGRLLAVGENPRAALEEMGD